MKANSLLAWLLRTLSQLATAITTLASATAIYATLSETGSMPGAEKAAWLIAGSVGLVTSICAIIGTAYYERFAEAPRLIKLMATVSVVTGAVLISLFIMLR
jgi:hypothetical protein